MEAVIFCGIQGSGKTTFYKERFFRTHLRISLDLLHTRNKEARFLQTCFTTYQRFVVDNTNPSIAERRRYIETARAARFRVVCYFFETEVHEAIVRNSQRTGKELIPIAGIKGTFKKLQAPTYSEGFDLIYIVKIQTDRFIVMLLEKPKSQADELAKQSKE